MKQSHPLALALYAALLAVPILIGVDQLAGPPPLIAQLPASLSTGEQEYLVYPIGNQQVRRWVVFVPSQQTLYDYNDDGELDKTWRIVAPGQDFERQ